MWNTRVIRYRCVRFTHVYTSIGERSIMEQGGVRASVSDYQLSEEETDGIYMYIVWSMLYCRYIHADLVKEFEAALDQDLSEAVAAIKTLLQFIKNCKGKYIHVQSHVHTHIHRSCIYTDNELYILLQWALSQDFELSWNVQLRFWSKHELQLFPYHQVVSCF